jgi:23S rRNA pseudouridine1911/1915/1917 synthase
LSDPFKQASGVRKVLTADETAEGRLDAWLTAQLGEEFSRSRIKALIKEGQVLLKGEVVTDPQRKVRAGDSFEITLPEPEDPAPKGEAIPLDILYEDEDVIVISKPAGLVVHPGPGNWTGTLVNALIHHCGDSLSGIGGVRRPGIVHRLDKDTTGLMVVAKTDRAHRSLSKQFAEKSEGQLERGYLALVWGAPDRPHGTVDAPLDRHPHARDKRAVREGGRDAVTHWEMVERYAGNDGKPAASLLACTLETGRTHQIRVHLAHIGHPILGDETYATGFKTKAARLPPAARAALEALGRQALHAERLVFEHPDTGELMEFRSPLPADLAALRAALMAPS